MESFAFDSITIKQKFMRSMSIKWKFMQEHSSNLVKNWFCSEQIAVLDWPAQSPDSNSIENLWNEVKVEITKKKKKYKKMEHLWSAVQEAWYAIPKKKIPKTCGKYLS